MVKRVIAIVAAVVLALMGAVLVLVYAKGADSRALAGQAPTKVYVSKELVPIGTTLKDALRAQKIEVTELAAKGVPTGALKAIDSANDGQVALADIVPGQYLLASAFGDKAPNQKAIEIPDGQVAISVSLEDPNRVGAFVTRGSFVTIYYSYGLKKVGTDEATKQFNELGVNATSVLLGKVTVIGVGASGLPPAPEPSASPGSKTQSAAVPSTLLTLAVSPEDSIKLVGAIQANALQNNPAKHLYFGLHGSDVTVDPRLNWNTLLSTTGQTP